MLRDLQILRQQGDLRQLGRGRQRLSKQQRRRFTQRRSLALHHVLVKIGRATNRLAGIVDDEVQPRKSRQQMRAERFDAGRVAQVESEDFEAIRPLGEIRFPRITLR